MHVDRTVGGDGVYELFATGIPAGSYEAKAAVGESWGENYGIGGVANGPNIPFAVSAASATLRFAFVSATNVLTIEELGAPVPEPGSLALAALAAGLLGLRRRTAGDRRSRE